MLLMHPTEGRCYSTAEIEEYLNGADCRDVTFRDTGARGGEDRDEVRPACSQGHEAARFLHER